MDSNDIYDHSYSAVQIRTESDPKVCNNRIWAAKNAGILVYNHGRGTIQNNEIFDNSMANLYVKTYARPIVTGNKIYDGRDAGVCILDGGRGEFSDNDIFRNRQPNVLITGAGSLPTLADNRVFDGKSTGIEVSDNAGCVLTRNQVFNNAFDGIALATGISVDTSSNRVYANKSLVDKCIGDGRCLFDLSSDNSFPLADFYRCSTCNTTDNDAICRSCKDHCHATHTVSLVRRDRFFCDCGAGQLAEKCHLRNYSADSDHESMRDSTD